jgi:hypothetical protein
MEELTDQDFLEAVRTRRIDPMSNPEWMVRYLHLALPIQSAS